MEERRTLHCLLVELVADEDAVALMRNSTETPMLLQVLTVPVDDLDAMAILARGTISPSTTDVLRLAVAGIRVWTFAEESEAKLWRLENLLGWWDRFIPRLSELDRQIVELAERGERIKATATYASQAFIRGALGTTLVKAERALAQALAMGDALATTVVPALRVLDKMLRFVKFGEGERKHAAWVNAGGPRVVKSLVGVVEWRCQTHHREGEEVVAECKVLCGRVLAAIASP